jgi:hypothetical protein
MARKSRLQSRRVVSILLIVAAAGLIAAGVAKVMHDYLLSGSELIGWAIVPLALVLGLTWPVMCRAKTTNRKACGNWAYGFLFGCTKTAGHFTGKFRAQLGSNHEAKPAGSREPSEKSDVFRQIAPNSEPIKVTVEDGILAKCGFWVGFVSGIVGVIQAIAAFAH